MCDFRRSFGSFGAPKEQVKIESKKGTTNLSNCKLRLKNKNQEPAAVNRRP